jgi:hypothetical protein
LLAFSFLESTTWLDNLCTCGLDAAEVTHVTDTLRHWRENNRSSMTAMAYRDLVAFVVTRVNARLESLASSLPVDRSLHILCARCVFIITFRHRPY